MTSRVVIAAAGAGKTRHLLEQATSVPGQRALITTYTNENTHEIRRRLSSMPLANMASVRVLNWFQFLLQECVKPYQSHIYDINFLTGLNLTSKPSHGHTRAGNISYYSDSHGNLYSNRVSDLAVQLNELSNGAVARRLAANFDAIFIDEGQDLAGYDLDLLALLFASIESVVVVADPRQSVFQTNHSVKNKRHRGTSISHWFDRMQELGHCTIEQMTTNFRSCQEICDFADALYPSMEPSKSGRGPSAFASPVRVISISNVSNYLSQTGAQVLRWDRKQPDFGTDAMNFGEVKGLEFDHVLIAPTQSMLAFFADGSNLADVTRAKLYVGITRARNTLGIAVPDGGLERYGLPIWSPDSDNGECR